MAKAKAKSTERDRRPTGPAAPATPQPTVGAIPGEQLGGADTAMAASIAARMRQQMALRK